MGVDVRLIQKRIENVKLTIKCFEGVLWMSSQTATEDFLNCQRAGLEKAKAELERLEESLNAVSR